MKSSRSNPSCKQSRNFRHRLPRSRCAPFWVSLAYYRKFIADYAMTATALTDLTKKDAPNKIVWSPECEQAFRSLKEALGSSSVLWSPDFHRTFILQTDASNRGVGAVLSQRDDEGVERPVAFYSKKLLPREERYSTIEKECLAIKLATHVFRIYLLGRPFIIQTDHRSLEWLHRLKGNNARLTRWSLALQPSIITMCSIDRGRITATPMRSFSHIRLRRKGRREECEGPRPYGLGL